MTAAQVFSNLSAWQVMAWGLVFFSALYVAGGLGMTALTGFLQRRGIGRVLDTRPLKPDQLRREWRQSFHSILVFGLGMVVPWGFVQLGWAHFAIQPSGWQIALEIWVLLIWKRCALLDQPPPAAYALVQALPWRPPPLGRGHPLVNL